ncbi:putative biopterin transporter family [Helianthus anomalus]
MPFLILSGHLCPPRIEGTLFALFMLINNLGATISGFLGVVNDNQRQRIIEKN